MIVSALKSIVYAPYRAVRFVGRAVAHRFTAVRHADAREQREGEGIVTASQSHLSPENLQNRNMSSLSTKPSLLIERITAAGVQGGAAERELAYQTALQEMQSSKTIQAKKRLLQKLELVDLDLLSSVTVESLNENQGLSKQESEQLSLIAIILKRIAKHMPERAINAEYYLQMPILGMELKDWKNNQKLKQHFVEHKGNWSKYAGLATDFCDTQWYELKTLIQEVKAQLVAELYKSTAIEQEVLDTLVDLQASSAYQALLTVQWEDLRQRGFSADECKVLSEISKCFGDLVESSSETEKVVRKSIKKALAMKIMKTRLSEWKDIEVANHYIGIPDIWFQSGNVKEGCSYKYFCKAVMPSIENALCLLGEYNNKPSLEAKETLV